jgi:2,5-furandicarboxylate decarboxylase 1
MIAGLAEQVRGAIAAEPLYFAEIAERFADAGFAAVARALGELHRDGVLWQNPVGRFCLKGSKFAAEPPARPKN